MATPGTKNAISKLVKPATTKAGVTPATAPTGAAAGPFITPTTFTPSNVTAAPSGTSKDPIVPGPFDPLRTTYGNLVQQGIPQAFIDSQINTLNQEQSASGIAGSPQQIDAQAQAYFGNQIQREWAALPNKNKQDYQGYDASAIQQINSTNNQTAANNIYGAMPAQQAAQANQNWTTNVQPALSQVQQTAQAQRTGNLAAEADIKAQTGTYANTVNANQAARTADVQSTNAADNALFNTLTNATNATNASNQNYANQAFNAVNSTNASNQGYVNNILNSATSTNALNSGLAQQLMGAASSTNANQTGLYNTLKGQASAANAQQTAGLGKLIGDIGDANNLQNVNLQVFQRQLEGLNDEDRANYLKYIGETDPQMATLLAQGSDPELVGNQKDVLNRWKELSVPQATAQERLLAEQARQKFEGDDQSSREALMAQLAGRGLKSGGLVIAGQQASGQQRSNDRYMAEMGLNASAVQRGIQGLQGYGDTANILRNADDGVRQFQDIYKQNEATRVSNLAQNRVNTGLNTTAQQGQRDQAGYNAGTETVNNNFSRNLTGYNANTETVNNNYGRNESVFNAGTLTNNNNFNRTQTGIQNYQDVNAANDTRLTNANQTGINTNQTNLGNTGGAIALGQQTNQTNLGNTGALTTTGLGVNSTNSTRTQGALNAGDTTAANVLGTGLYTPNTQITNRANEATQAQNVANTLGNAALTQNTIQGNLSKAQQDALNKILLGGDTALAQQLLAQA